MGGCYLYPPRQLKLCYDLVIKVKSFTRNTKQTKSEEVVDLKDVDGTEMLEVTESDSDEDDQVEEGGDTEHHSPHWESQGENEERKYR